MATALEQGVASKGGSSVLIDEYTATWCQICAVVDPLVPIFLEPNGERVAYVSIHPDDGIDLLGNNASTTRIDWLLGDPVGTPTFIFDGGEKLIGSVTPSQLHSELLRAESARPRFSELQLSVSREASALILELVLTGVLGEGEMLSLLITEDGVSSFDPAGEPMESDHVLRAMISVELSADDSNLVLAAPDDTHAAWNASASTISVILRATVNISGDWDIGSLGFVGIHEARTSSGHSVLGAVQVVQRESPDVEKSTNALWLLAAGTVLAGGIALASGMLFGISRTRSTSEE